MHIRTSITAILVITTLMISSVATLNLQQASAFGFVESQQIGEFRKLIGELDQKIINNHRQSPNSEKISQFRILLAQFERDVIDAVLNDHLNLIPDIVLKHTKSLKAVLLFGEALDALDRKDIDAAMDGVLRIFCEPCI